MAALSKHPRIGIDPAVMLGKPVIAGTRITVEIVLETLGEAECLDGVFEAFPVLTKQDVAAALAYAAERLPDPPAAAE
jgi:uncharacterized protein (DUF433 family)